MPRHFYSFTVVSPDVLDFPEHLLILDRGRNVFNLSVLDLEAFQAELQAKKVRIEKVNDLEERDPLTEEDRRLL